MRQATALLRSGEHSKAGEVPGRGDTGRNAPIDLPVPGMVTPKPRIPTTVAELTIASLVLAAGMVVVSLLTGGGPERPPIVHRVKLTHRRGARVVKTGSFTITMDPMATMRDFVGAVLDAMKLDGGRWVLWEVRVENPALVKLTRQVDLSVRFFAPEVLILKGPENQHIAIEAY
jgi:hypothetical protein